MKKIAGFLVVVLLSVSVFAGEAPKVQIPYDSTTQKYTYTKIVEVPAASAKDLYTITKEWSKAKFGDDKFDLDEEGKQIVDLGNFTINMVMNAGMVKIPQAYMVIYKVKTYFKDGKCKIEIVDMKFTQNANGVASEQTIESFEKQMQSIGMGKKIAEKFVNDCFVEVDKNVKQVMTELEKNLTGEIKPKSDW